MDSNADIYFILGLLVGLLVMVWAIDPVFDRIDSWLEEHAEEQRHGQI